jgi:ribosomal protein L39E
MPICVVIKLAKIENTNNPIPLTVVAKKSKKETKREVEKLERRELKVIKIRL